MGSNKNNGSFGRIDGKLLTLLAALIGCNANAAHELIYATDLENNFLSFYSDIPNRILCSHHISGLQATEEIRGIDFWNGILYGLGSSSRLYTIDPNTGAATQVGSFSPLLDGISFGCDNDPTGFRVVSGAGTTNHQNLSINRTTGAVSSVGPALSYATGDPFVGESPLVDALAYDTNGVWYAGDSLQNTFATLDLTTGKLTTIGMSGIDFSRNNGFDISPATGIAYFASPAASSDPQANLYTVNRTTGLVTLVGTIGNSGDNILIRGLTVVPNYSLTTSVAPVGSGVVTNNPDQVGYVYNQTVTLTPVPTLGWIFTGWSGEASGTNDPLSVTMTTNKSITANFTNISGCVLPSGLVSWWPGAGNANDIIGNNNGTLQYGATYAAGKVGQGFSFDGVDDYVALPSASAIPTPWTAEFWVNRQDSSQPSALLLGDGAGSLKLEQFPNTRHVGFTQYGVADYSFNYIAPAGTWVHLVFVAGSDTRLYVNGALQDTLSATISLPLGRLGEFTKGIVDEASVYNRALSVSEILALYNAGSAGKCLTPLYITSVNRSGTNLNLSWLAQQGVSYRVQYKTNLTDPTWLDVGGDVPAITNTASTTNVILPGVPQRFYRVRLLQ